MTNNLLPLDLNLINSFKINPANFVRDYSQQVIVLTEHGTFSLDPEAVAKVPMEHRDKYVAAFNSFVNSLVYREPDSENYTVKILTPIVVNSEGLIIEGNSRINLIRQASKLVSIGSIDGLYRIDDTVEASDASIVGYNLSIPIIREYRWRVLEAFYQSLVKDGLACDKAARKVLKKYQAPRNRNGGEILNAEKMSATYIGSWQKRIKPIGSAIFNLLDSEKISLKMFAIAVEKLTSDNLDEFIAIVEALETKVTNPEQLAGILDKLTKSSSETGSEIGSETNSETGSETVNETENQTVIESDTDTNPQPAAPVDEATLWEIPGIDKFPDIAEKLRYVRDNHPDAVLTPQFNRLRMALQTVNASIEFLVTLASKE